MNSRVRRTYDVALLILVGAAAMTVVTGMTGPLRSVLILAAVILVPGSAFARFLHPNDAGIFLGLAVALSLAVGTVGAMLLVWTGWWHPVVLGVVVATISSWLLFSDIRAISRENQGVPA